VDYQTVGVILTVTPRISPDGFVRMDVGTTNSALSSSNVQISENASLPIINERLATTTVSVQSGQSIIIGGLISSMEDTRSKRVPWLGNLPLFGALFRSTSNLKDRKELLIFLTPQVLVKMNDEGRTIDAHTMTRRQLDHSGIQKEIDANLLEQNLWEDGRLNPDVPELDPEFKDEESEPLL
jgi:type II secretory pathway component GspD/PulD (secretin)